jgi:adenylylsulfate kinase-like enzyme
MIFWLTGQPGAGKTILGLALKEQINNSIHIDGDDLRSIFDNLDYGENGRRRNVEASQQIAYFLHIKGFNVIVSLVSPYKDQRESFKKKLGGSLIELYIHTTEIRGKEKFHVDDYQKPTENFLDVDTTNICVEDTLKKIIKFI